MHEKSQNGIEKKVYAEALRKATQQYEELLGELSIQRLFNDSLRVGMSFSDICHKLVQFLTGALDVENASVMVTDREQGELRLLVAKSFFEDEGSVFHKSVWPGKTFKVGEGIAGQVANSRKSILIHDTHQDPRFVKAGDQKVSIRSVLCLPLMHGDRLHGVLNLSNSEPGAFDERRRNALSIITSTASVALSHALAVEELRQLNEELEVRNKELAAVIALSESLHANLDLDSVLTKSLEDLVDGFDIDAAGVFLKERETPIMPLRSYRTTLEASNIETVLESLGASFSKKILRSKEPSSYPGPFEVLAKKGIHSFDSSTCVVIPLFSGEDCFGMLMILGPNGTGLEKAEMRLLNSLCIQIGVAVQNSILVSRLRENIRDLNEARHQLIQSEKLAVLGETLSGVAHEINNPLAAIMGYSELLLREESLSEQNRRMLRKILLCVDRSRKIVRGLLSFARKTELQKKEVDIHKIIDGALEHRDYELTVNSIEIARNYEALTPFVAVDPHQMEQVFLNLINNAYDSMTESNVPGKLKIATSLIEGPSIQIEFIDTGRGIQQADKGKVFEPFFTTKDVGKGTGLGLSISYGIIKEHGGNLCLDDDYRDGAKFVVTLPIVAVQRSAAPPGEHEEVSALPKSQAKILVVDDEEVVTDFMQLALSSRGFEVDCASDGEEAYRMAGSNAYDLIITDIRMPGAMDGRSLFIRLRDEMPKMADRFVFISGDMMEEKTAGFLKETGRAFLLKPFSIDDLRHVVEKTLLERAS